MKEWYIAQDGKTLGPYTKDEIQELLLKGIVSENTYVWKAGFEAWKRICEIEEFSQKCSPISTPDFQPPAPPAPSRRFKADVIDYTIYGNEMQFVEVELDPGESAVAEAGAMMYMEEDIAMETVFGDGSEASESGGLLGKLIGAGKRLLTGESLFCTIFTNKGNKKSHVAFAAPYPGKIIPLDLKDYNGEIICQKDAFLCAAKGVSIGIAFQKKIGVALFGGEGFIMERLSGDGLTFVHAGGTIIEKDLAPGEIIRIDTGCLVALTNTVSYDIEYVGNVKSALFGGEGFFFATLRGPGHVWLQSLPFSRLAGRILASAPQEPGSSSVGEGSILGGLSNLFQD